MEEPGPRNASPARPARRPRPPALPPPFFFSWPLTRPKTLRLPAALPCPRVVEGVLTHQLKRFCIDGNRAVLAKPTHECKTEDFEFGENEVYACDVVMSTGEGKVRRAAAEERGRREGGREGKPPGRSHAWYARTRRTSPPTQVSGPGTTE